ncbi:MAG: FAD-binding oxidoreductase, partial [Nitrosopumilaceae archaeon]
MNTGLLRRKISKITSEAFWEKEILDYYSVDSSSYQIRPIVVVIPKTIQDVTSVVKFAAKNRISVIPRGAGTGLVGSSIGNGIIMDLKYFNKIS